MDDQGVQILAAVLVMFLTVVVGMVIREGLWEDDGGAR